MTFLKRYRIEHFVFDGTAPYKVKKLCPVDFCYEYTRNCPKELEHVPDSEEKCRACWHRKDPNCKTYAVYYDKFYMCDRKENGGYCHFVRFVETSCIALEVPLFLCSSGRCYNFRWDSIPELSADEAFERFMRCHGDIWEKCGRNTAFTR